LHNILLVIASVVLNLKNAGRCCGALLAGALFLGCRLLTQATQRSVQP